MPQQPPQSNVIAELLTVERRVRFLERLTAVQSLAIAAIAIYLVMHHG